MTSAAAVDTIASNLRIFHPAGEVFEIRLFGKFGSVSGFFDDPEKAAAELARYDGRAEGTYHVLNVVDPDLLARSPNRLQGGKRGGSTADRDILRRRFVALDIDADRDPKTNATAEEKDAAAGVFRRIKVHLEDNLGWPAGFVVDSGNGYQGGWPIDEPNDPETSAVLKRILRRLAEKFDEPGVAHVDLSVWSSAQLLKLPGTMVKKGPHSAERPHRRSELLAAHTSGVWTPRSALEALAGPPEVKVPQEAYPAGNGSNGGGDGPFDLEAFIADSGMRVRHHRQTAEGEVWEIAVCPFNADHNRGEAFISQRADGAKLAGCHHNSCTWQWDDLRDKFQPEHKEFMRQQAEALAKQAEKDAAREARAARRAGPPPPEDDEPAAWEGEGEAEAARDLESEAAHAAVLRGKWLGRYRFAAHVNKWKRWDGTVWATVTDSVVADAACKVLVREYGRQIAEVDAGEEAKRKRLFGLYKSACTFRGVSGALAFLRGQDGVHTDVEQWDADPYILNCADGLLDLRTCELRGHDSAAMCTRITAWGLGKDGRASSGAWERHLAMCLPSADVRRQVQRDLGRSLVDAVLEHSLAIWYGIGRNGKSTTSEALLKGLAGYGMEASKDLLVQTKHERHPTEIAELAGARVVFVEETTDGKHLDEAQVKRLTGGGVKRARFMRQDNFNVPQTFSISLLVNHRPHVTGGDPGIWERLRLVPWTTRIPRAEQRPQEEVVAELDADGAYMLRWLVAGFKDWQADHHWIADEVQAATRDYRAEEDVLQGFVDRYCIEGPRLSVPRGELYEVWIADFMRRSPNDPKPSKIAFGKMLRDRGVIAAVEGHANTKVYRGIGLRTRSDREQLEWDETPAN